MKAHLRAHFLRTAEHHVAKAKHHREIAKHAGQLLEMHKTAKSDMEGLDELLESYIEQHSAIADEHTSMAAHCTEYAKVFSASGKAMGVGDDFDAPMPMPEGLSRVTPNVPHNHLRAVPRHGSRPMPISADAQGDSFFSKLFATEE